MFVAGFILWANTRVTIIEFDDSRYSRGSHVVPYADGFMRDVEYGWPLPICKFGTWISYVHFPKVPLNEPPPPSIQPPAWYHEGFEFWVGCCFIDAIVALAILFSVMIACERLQRKRTN